MTTPAARTRDWRDSRIIPFFVGVLLIVVVSVLARQWLTVEQANRVGLGVGIPVSLLGHRGWLALRRLPLVAGLLALSGALCPPLLGWLDRVF
jgi:hypothetical protein